MQACKRAAAVGALPALRTQYRAQMENEAGVTEL